MAFTSTRTLITKREYLVRNKATVIEHPERIEIITNGFLITEYSVLQG